MSARVGIGVPLYERAEFVGEAVRSLLAQTHTDFALVLVDDGSSDNAWDAAQEAAGNDPRVTLHRNASRIGMVDNWRLAYELTREAAPELEYFAWGSDHDRWHERWLEILVEALDKRPRSVLAYPRDERIDGDGHVVRGPQADFSTEGIDGAVARIRRCATGMRAGSMVYGLMRADALERAGVFPRVLHADRTLMFELALQGEFVQVPEVLWSRRFLATSGTRRRQRSSLFAGTPPAFTFLPSWVVQAAVFFRRYVIEGRSRIVGLLATGVLVTVVPAHELRMRAKPVQRFVRRARRRLTTSRR